VSRDLLRLAVVQMTSTDDIEANLAAVRALYEQAVLDHAELVVFPENTLFFRLQAKQQLVTPNSSQLKGLEQMVKQAGVSMLLTTAVADQGHVTNSTLLFEASSAARVVYSKVHLFDVDVPGAPPVRESDYFRGGDRPAIIDIAGWRFGLSICYDVRFSELYSHYAQQADVILVPSAFLVPTGMAHWHVLLRARAIESQCYVVASAQAGEHISAAAPGSKRSTYGHSLAVDPWGRVVVDIEEQNSVRVIELDRSLIASIRHQVPMSSHRRLK
jgi:predicted amidohydrolase